MPATKRGIFHNLKESKYIISNSEIMFFFSSRLYQHKFMEGYKEHRIHFINKLPVKPLLNMETLADITYYIETEKRGFHSWLKGVEISCEEIHRYALRKMTDKNTLNWYEMQRLKLEERLKIME